MSEANSNVPPRRLLGSPPFEEVAAVQAARAMAAHRWPGNLTELRSRIEKAVCLASGAVVSASDLGLARAGELTGLKPLADGV